MNRNDDGSATATFTAQLKNATGGDLAAMDPWNHVANEAAAKGIDIKTVASYTAIYQQVSAFTMKLIANWEFAKISA